MRKLWMAIAMIALLVGLAAGYRMGRVGSPRPEPARADRAAASQLAESRPREDTPASSVPATSTSSSTRGQDVSRPGPRGDVAGSTRSLESSDVEQHTVRAAAGDDSSIGITPSISNAPRNTVAFPESPTGTLRGQSPTAGAPSQTVVSPPVPYVPNSASAPTTTGAQNQEPPKVDPTPSPTDDPESDRHPPTLLYLRFDPPEIRDGGVATLSVGASDDLSGVKFVYGTVRSPSEAAIVPFTAQDANGSGVFTVSIAIPQHAETGDWFVGSLQIVDKADNPLNLVYAKATVPPGGALHVLSDESDSTAPSVHRVTVDKGTVGAGEKNQIVVDVDDDRSGVASVTGSFQSPSKSAYIPFACRASGDSSWVGDVPIPTNADCGEWTLSLLRVADKANNTAFLTMDSPQVGNVGFVVSGGGGCDSDPPVIDALRVSPAVVSNTATSEVTLTIAAHDDGSGVDSLSGHFDGPVAADGQVPKIYFAAKPDPSHPDAPMITRIPVPQHAASGIWKVALVQIMDKARNTRTYNRDDPALVNASFVVE